MLPKDHGESQLIDPRLLLENTDFLTESLCFYIANGKQTFSFFKKSPIILYCFDGLTKSLSLLV